MNKKLKIGIIGCGNFALINHIPCLLSNRSVEISWVYDSSKNQIEQANLMYGLSGLENDQLDNGLNDIDLVLLTVPYGVRDIFYSLLSSKKIAVYVEKPFSKSLSEHQLIAEKFKSLPLTIGFNRRSYKNHQIIKSIIVKNMFGQLKKILIRQGAFSISGGSGFRSDSNLSGGGILIESGIHLIDAAIYITDPISTVVTQKKMLSNAGIDYHTEAKGQFLFESINVPFSVEISTLQNFLSGLWFEFENLILHCPINPSESISIVDRSGEIIGELNMYVDGALTIEESISMTWDLCIENYFNCGSGAITSNDVALTTKFIEQLYTMDE